MALKNPRIISKSPKYLGNCSDKLILFPSQLQTLLGNMRDCLRSISTPPAYRVDFQFQAILIWTKGQMLLHRRRARCTRCGRCRSTSFGLIEGGASPRDMLEGAARLRLLLYDSWAVSFLPSLEEEKGLYHPNPCCIWTKRCIYLPSCTYWVLKAL